jgi:hypothetical protein
MTTDVKQYIAGCNDDECKIKEDCFRFTSKDNMMYRLSAFYNDETPCFFFWPNKKERKE